MTEEYLLKQEIRNLLCNFLEDVYKNGRKNVFEEHVSKVLEQFYRSMDGRLSEITKFIKAEEYSSGA